MDYFRVRKWETFQHYKKRNPPWIKLYTHLLDDYEFGCLQDASKVLAFYILMLAAKTGNKIPMDSGWVKNRASLTQTPDFEPLLSMGFIEKINASNTLASCKQVAMPEERRGEESIQKESPKGHRNFREEMRGALKAIPK